VLVFDTADLVCAKQSFLCQAMWFPVHYACQTAGLREEQCAIRLEVKSVGFSLGVWLFGLGVELKL